MSSPRAATAPRDRASAARTLVAAAMFSLVATAGWEVVAASTGHGATDPASSAGSIGLAAVVGSWFLVVVIS